MTRVLRTLISTGILTLLVMASSDPAFAKSAAKIDEKSNEALDTLYGQSSAAKELGGSVRANRLEAGGGSSVACSDAKSLPVFQQLARDNSPHGDDVYPVSAFAAAGRRSAV